MYQSILILPCNEIYGKRDKQMMQLSSHKGYSLRQISWAQREGGTFFKMAILLRFWAFHAQKKKIKTALT